jgi:hypothetical protein
MFDCNFLVSGNISPDIAIPPRNLADCLLQNRKHGQNEQGERYESADESALHASMRLRCLCQGHGHFSLCV